jgi:hypothetical protein
MTIASTPSFDESHVMLISISPQEVRKKTANVRIQPSEANRAAIAKGL